MSLATVFSRALHGMQAPLVRVEVHLSGGLPCFNLVGLAETSVKESRERVRSAILNSRFQFPSQRLTINLAPADLPKQGGRYDLAIAIGILIASGQIKSTHLPRLEFIGELSLNGELQSVPGVLPACLNGAAQQHISVIPASNLMETQVIDKPQLLAFRHLLNVTEALQQESIKQEILKQKTLKQEVPEPEKSSQQVNPFMPGTMATQSSQIKETIDIANVKGQLQAKRALEIAAAGRHNMLMSGPPGAGKTLLASCLPGLLPPPTAQQSLEIAIIRSISQSPSKPLDQDISQRPFRRPHHTSSGVALVGGGSIPSPGEITLAHQGVLFLDELPEFKRGVLDVLREPLEAAEITISRAQTSLTFPADFQLIAAMNPCPCGYAGDNSRQCQCSAEQIKRYRGQLSGPLLDRIDIHLQVPRQSLHLLQQQENHPPAAVNSVLADETAASEFFSTPHVGSQVPQRHNIQPMIELPNEQESPQTSQIIRKRVIKIQQRQLNRQGCCNSQLSLTQIQKICRLKHSDSTWWADTCEQLQLSSRGFHRSLLVARTIADLEGSRRIERRHLLEALSFRQTI